MGFVLRSAFRIAVVLLLIAIAIELGLWRDLQLGWRDLSRWARSIGATEEVAVPRPADVSSSGLLRLYSDRIDESIQRQLEAQRKADSANGGKCK